MILKIKQTKTHQVQHILLVTYSTSISEKMNLCIVNLDIKASFNFGQNKFYVDFLARLKRDQESLLFVV